VIVRELAALERFLPGGVEGSELDAGASVHRLPTAPAAAAMPAGGEEEEMQGAEVGSSMRAVAPPIQSFAMGRRR